ncbi:uncharacterized protein FA14DRAFT_185601 [Meira miltonrushii]|uniref:Uncharacterized protein n=1 Tax=Meira miltonrushii TaxID=1280837 RepID=A0A316V7K3_9BASI|nr:uncharacterized protein FA14DRAFT_185601 [Meira miltonrushii]PWN32481.1 hypothetical protein FA14DRAFT_185601 [Meira miltonrushii]
MNNLSYFFIASLISSLISLNVQAGKETGMNHASASSPRSSPKSHGAGINLSEQATVVSEKNGGAPVYPKIAARIHSSESAKGKQVHTASETTAGPSKASAIHASKPLPVAKGSNVSIKNTSAPTPTAEKEHYIEVGKYNPYLKKHQYTKIKQTPEQHEKNLARFGIVRHPTASDIHVKIIRIGHSEQSKSPWSR